MPIRYIVCIILNKGARCRSVIELMSLLTLYCQNKGEVDITGYIRSMGYYATREDVRPCMRAIDLAQLMIDNTAQ